MNSIITIANYKTNMPTSKFAPKEQIVYVLPSINECLGLLPRNLGNYILSYTTAWFDFYLDNLIQKYGSKFVLQVLYKIYFKTFGGIYFEIKKSWNRFDIEVKCREFIFKISKLKFNRTLIMNEFKLGLQIRQQFIIDKQLMLKACRDKKNAEKNEWYSKIQRGSIIHLPSPSINFRPHYYLIIEKTKASYTSIEVELLYTNSNSYLVSLKYPRQQIKQVQRNYLFETQSIVLEYKPVNVVYTYFVNKEKFGEIKPLVELKNQEEFMEFNKFERIGKLLKYHLK